MLQNFKITSYPANVILSQQNYAKYIEVFAGVHPHFLGSLTPQSRYYYLYSATEWGAFTSSIAIWLR